MLSGRSESMWVQKQCWERPLVRVDELVGRVRWVGGGEISDCCSYDHLWMTLVIRLVFRTKHYREEIDCITLLYLEVCLAIELTT